MSKLIEYIVAIAVCSPLFFFILAVVFRLLDNSTSIFLDHDILVDSTYVSRDFIKEQIVSTEDIKLKKELKRALLYRKLHNLFIVLAVLSLPPVIITCFLIYMS
ncbi:hypothetical protein GCM10022393_09290 [Aquimarina addita]|uniref:Uncharacterized protein n=1 Tax=Aquimarina addita TaxID=870485 RepID=A0ABP7XD17_9FLAO